MIQDRKIALIWRTICFVLVLAGLLSHTNVFSGELNLRIYMYYTIQSNLLALVLFGMLVVRTAMGLREGRRGNTGYFARFEMICVIDLLLTFLVYWVMLVPNAFSMGRDPALWTFSNLSVHGITPALCILDYLLFTESGHLKYRDVYLVCVYPYFYIALASVAGLAGFTYRTGNDGNPVRFPYFFIDYDRVGVKAVGYIAGLTVFFLILSHGLYLFDKKVRKPRLVPRSQRKNRSAGERG